MKIAIVAGEASGDLLGAALMRSIQAKVPDAHFVGIGGKEMIALGFQSLYPMETLSVMGFIEPLKRLPELFRIKNGLLKYFLDSPPDVFIGIDSPDFNHRIEKPLKDAGIPSVHYVSPSVWAWRQGRVKGIRKAVDLMLCLLPFEAVFYEREKVPAVFVGHPMADEIPLSVKDIPEVSGFKSDMNLERPAIALLPGSRFSEIEKIAPVFIEVADRLHLEQPDISFLVPASSEKIYSRLTEMIEKRSYISIHHGKSREILGVSKAALVASGTATLEAMLMKCPMVVAYKADKFSWFVGSRLVKSEYVSLANLVAGRGMVKERLQDDCNVEVLLADLKELLSEDISKNMVQEFTELHAGLRHDASNSAAQAILGLIGAS